MLKIENNIPIYKKITDGTYDYHCFTAVEGTPRLIEERWQVARETIATGEITYPEVDGEPNDESIFPINAVAGLTYYEVI